MPYIDHARKELRFKIVYYGIGLGGKTTNLEYIHKQTRPERRGKLLALQNAAERTLFFDLLPVEIGRYKDYEVRVHLCTVPGQIAQDKLRQVILRHVDGVVMVVDCQPTRALENLQALQDLQTNLSAVGYDPARLPSVLQWNKRDLVGSRGVERMREALQIPAGVVQVVASAARGEGVFETFKAVLKECLALVGTPASAPAGHSPSVIPTPRASMFAAPTHSPQPRDVTQRMDRTITSDIQT
jgi:signal recognition particle receptor subunit beta